MSDPQTTKLDADCCKNGRFGQLHDCLKSNTQTTTESRIDRLEKTVIKLQEQLNGLYEARMIDHNRSIDRDIQNSGGGLLDGIF